MAVSRPSRPHPAALVVGLGRSGAGAGAAAGASSSCSARRSGFGRPDRRRRRSRQITLARVPAEPSRSRRAGRRRRRGAGRRRSRDSDSPHPRQVDAGPAAAARRGRRATRPTWCCSPARPRARCSRCSRSAPSTRVAVVPFGGGTSVVGGLDARRGAGSPGVVALDLRRLNALLELDEESRLAVLEPGLRGREAEALLAEHGYTIGHFPQSFEYATLGGFAAARSSGQASAGYGRFDELVLGLRVATPAGTLELGRAPEVRRRPRPAPADARLGGRARRDHRAHASQVRPVPASARLRGLAVRLVRRGRRRAAPAASRTGRGRPCCGSPTRPRPRSTSRARPQLGERGRRAAAWRSSASRAPRPRSRRRRDGAPRCCGRARRPSSTPSAGESWARGALPRALPARRAARRRRAGRDARDGDVLVRACPGSTPRSRARCATSLTAQGRRRWCSATSRTCIRPAPRCTSPSAAPRSTDPVAQWRAAKAAASDAILAAGGSITHHHGVGRDHRDWYAARDRRARRRGAARGQGGARSRRDPQSRAS